MRIVDIGVRIFGSSPNGAGRDPKSGASLAVDRRTARAMRRRRDRYIRRRSVFLDTLIRYGLMPADTDEAKLVAAKNPYSIRARALTERLEPYEIGRALFHLNQRRGFLSNRKAERRSKDSEDGKIASGAKALDQAMAEAGADTLGQFLAGRSEKRVRLNGESQGYDFYPQRRHVEYEFQRIWEEQAKHHPILLTEEARAALHRILFFQRPLKEPVVGVCLFAGRYGIARDERRLPKAHPLFQERRLYEEVNQLEITTPGEAPRKLTLDQRDKLILASRDKRKVAFTSLAKTLKLQPGESFNKASEARTDLTGNEVRAVLGDKKRFGAAWHHKTPEAQWEIIERLIDEENPEALHDYLTGTCGLGEEAADAVAKAPLPEGFGRLGETATRRILEQLKTGEINGAPLTYSQAVEACGWHHSDDRTGEVLDRLPYYGELLSRDIPPGTFDPRDLEGGRREKKIERYWGKITNPTVHIGLRQLEKLVNAIIAVHGRPDQIVVELARELNLSEKDKDEHNRRIRKDTADAQARSRKLIEEGIADTGANRARLKLWEELAGNPVDRFCPYCGDAGKLIGFRALFSDEVDIDHVIPYSRSLDDSAANKVVAHRNCNRAKGNKTPYERWGSDPERWDRIAAQVANLRKSKQWRFGPDAMERVEKDGGFLARQLTDTQYLSRLAGKYLRSLYPTKEDGRVFVITGRMTAMLRRLWALNDVLDDSKIVENKNSNAPKNRLDHRHHAIDAFVCAVTSQSLLTRIAAAAGRAEEKDLDRQFEDLPEPWPGYLPELRARLLATVVSFKPDHGRKGVPSPMRDVTAARLHDDTAYGLTGEVGPDGRTPVVVKRVAFLSLEPKDISDPERIRDATLRADLYRATQGLSGTAFQQALMQFKETHPVFRGIRHVRVLGERPGTTTLSVIPIKDKAGRAFKAYKGNANARFIVWRLPDGGWKHSTVSVFAAHQRGYELPRPHPAAKKILDLRQNDLVAIERDGTRAIMRVVKFSESGQVTLAAHNEGGALKARDAASNDIDPFKYVAPTAGGLKKLKARQVRIDPLGRVFDPGPR
ncbi:MAG TPA: type II CRISPR RNA-guided endonuclease Cas9 [Sphingomonadaceae bacterium]|nr:type II CRISPR RNA-guided endonuclease Cas9 [Sphingomonadaceae bacterium]